VEKVNKFTSSYLNFIGERTYVKVITEFWFTCRYSLTFLLVFIGSGKSCMALRTSSFVSVLFVSVGLSVDEFVCG